MFGRGDAQGDPATADGGAEATSLSSVPSLAAGPVIDAGRAARQAELGFSVGGAVAELLVAEGDFVEEGEVLARLSGPAAHRGEPGAGRPAARPGCVRKSSRRRPYAGDCRSRGRACRRQCPPGAPPGTLPGQIAAAEADVAGARRRCARCRRASARRR